MVGFISLVLTLLLEQLRPLPAGNPVYGTVRRTSAWVERNLNAGRWRHGVYAWLLLIVGASLLVGGFYALALSVHWLLALVVNVVVLFFTLGFRQFSHHGTEIQLALSHGDLAAARRELTLWKQQFDPAYTAADLAADEVVRQAIEHGLLLAHRHVFGVLFWFVLLPGPVGAVVYRLSEHVARAWNRPAAALTPPDRFGDFARHAFAWIDWLPARLTALGFAIVGDFEGAIYCWRQVSTMPAAERMPTPDSRTLILAAASGALGVRVMPAADAARHFAEAGDDGGGLAEPTVPALRAVVGLVWRALLLWLALLALLTLANWFA